MEMNDMNMVGLSTQNVEIGGQELKVILWIHREFKDI